VELLQLRCFVTIAETRSFTAAAVRLHVSQPALSYQIKHLENELRTRLFDRSSRRVSLTVDGRAFLPLAQSVLSKAHEAVRMMEERLGAELGDVTFGSLPSVGSHVVPHLLQTFRQSFPGVQVQLVEGASDELEEGVLSGDLDFAILGTTSAHQSLEVHPLIVEELLAVVPTTHRLAGRHRVGLTELEHEDFILLSSSFILTQQILEACRQAGFEPHVAYHTGSLDSARNFVRHDLGIGILPRLGLAGQDEEGLLGIPFDEPLTRTLNLVRAKDRYATVATRALMVHVRTTMVKAFGGAPAPRD